jgi:hypothetical protein
MVGSGGCCHGLTLQFDVRCKNHVRGNNEEKGDILLLHEIRFFMKRPTNSTMFYTIGGKIIDMKTCESVKGPHQD